jgi:hypothetical protein
MAWRSAGDWWIEPFNELGELLDYAGVIAVGTFADEVDDFAIAAGRLSAVAARLVHHAEPVPAVVHVGEAEDSCVGAFWTPAASPCMISSLPASKNLRSSRLMQCSKNQHFGQLVPLFDRLRALAEHADGFTIVPRAGAFGSAIHDLAQPSRKAQTGR